VTIMARIRSIKPEFWTSAQVLECSTNSRLLFIGLWNFCDDYGRHPLSPKQCKAEVFPADNFTEKDILGMLQELSKNDLISVYVNENKEYFYIPGWRHQRIDKPQQPKYPDPFSEHSKIILGTLPPDRIGEDRIGEDSPKPNGSDHTHKIRKERTAIIYTAEFESFWLLYPDKRNNSKPRAFEEWQKLSQSDQEAAVRSIPSFSDYCRSDKDYRVVHCERYLSQRRFDGWSDQKPKSKYMMV